MAKDDHSMSPSWPGWSEATTKRRRFGLEMQMPFAGYVLEGRKSIETRAYALPPDLLSRHDRDVRIDILESEKGRDGLSSVPDIVSLSDDDGSMEHPLLKRTGWCTFVRSFRYTTLEQFEADVKKHLVNPSSGYGWSDERPMYGWVVGSCSVYERDGEDDDDDDDDDDEGSSTSGCATAERRMRSLFELLPRKKNDAPTVLITGASGMLGRALHRLLLKSSQNYDVIGAGHTRLRVDHYPQYFSSVENNDGDCSTRTNKTVKLQRLDLLDAHATTEFLEKYRPDVIVHCAAERYPDAFEAKREESMKLNVEGTRHLARECRRIAATNNAAGDGGGVGGPYLIFISTSYVFDGGLISGERPPYRPQSEVNPINSYGRSKLEGERAVREILNDPRSSTEGDGEGRGIVVRVPLLYGEDCANLSESPALEATEVFLPAAARATGKKSIDDWALRFPTSVEDVACVLKLVVDRLMEREFPAVTPNSDTYHVSSPHGTTKYELVRLQARLMGIPTSRVEEQLTGNSVGPPKNSAPRPRCTQLDCVETWEALGLNGEERFEFVSLEKGMERALNGFPERFL